MVTPHGEEPLQGVGGVCVLHGAVGLQVTDERQHGLQQLLLGKLQQETETLACCWLPLSAQELLHART